MGSSDDFARLYERHADGVFAAANNVLHDRVRAEDVTQDVFLQLWRGCGYDEERGPLGPYLRRMARNRALDVWRSNRSAQRMALRLQSQVGPSSSSPEQPDAAVLRSTDRDLTRRAVRRLPAEQRQVIGLAYWGGLTAEQASATLGVPLGTAKSRVRLGLRKLAGDPSMVMA